MNEQKPGWGATIGVFFLCGCLAVGACILTTAWMASGMGFSGDSNGGLTGAVTGVACAAYYRSTGKIAGPAIVSIIVGIVIGFIVIQLAFSGMGR